MSNTKELNTRIILRNDTLENWQSSEAVKLRPGEIGLARVTTWKKDNVTNDMIPVPTYLMKVGDGEKTFDELNWLAAPASDVHAWAKAVTKPTYNGTEIKVSEATDAKTVSATLTELAQAIGQGGTVSEQISTAIEAALEELVHTDEGTGSFVTAVTQADGAITISRRDLTADDIPALGISKITGLQDALDAKAALTDFNDLKDAVGDSSKGLVKALADEANTRSLADEALDKKISDLTTAIGNVSNIMNFVGVAVINGTETTVAAAAAKLYDEGESATDGDVIICGDKEYVYSGDAWIEFGDASGNANAITALDTRVTQNETDIAALKELDIANTYAEKDYVDEELDKKVDNTAFENYDTTVIQPIVTTVGNTSNGLVKDVNDLKTAVGVETVKTGDSVTQEATGLYARIEELETVSATHATQTDLNSQSDRIDRIYEKFGTTTTLADVLIFDCGTATTAY